jgi:hypothetical protein
MDAPTGRHHGAQFPPIQLRDRGRYTQVWSRYESTGNPGDDRVVVEGGI